MAVNIQFGPRLKWATISLAMFLFGQLVGWLSGGAMNDFTVFAFILSLVGFGLGVTLIVASFIREIFPKKEILPEAPEVNRWRR